MGKGNTFNIGRQVGGTNRTCGECGNSTSWRNVRIAAGRTTATCGKCGVKHGAKHGS